MRYLLIGLLALVVGAWVGMRLTQAPPPPDPITVIITQLKTQAIIEHERQIAIWYKACPEVVGVNPEVFVAWPGKLSYELPLDDVTVERSGSVVTVKTGGIRADEPALPTDTMDYLATEPILNLVNEQAIVNGEMRKASGIARYLASYYLKRDSTLYDAMAEQLQALVLRIAGAVDAGITEVHVEIPRPDPKLEKLPPIELCAGTSAAVNGLPFAKDESGHVVPIAFRTRTEPSAGSTTAPDAGKPRGTAVIIDATKKKGNVKPQTP